MSLIKDMWEDEGKLVTKLEQDVEPILENNKRLQNDGTGGWSKSRELRRVATVPLIVIDQWLREGINVFDPNHAEAVKRKLNDPQYAHLRTAPGRI